MAAGDLAPFHCRNAKHPTTAIDGIRAARIIVTGVSGEDPGDAAMAGGPEKVLLQRQRIDVELYGNNPNALRALVAATAANLVIGQKGEAGANEKHTIKNVYFTDFTGPLEIRDPDSGGPIPMYGVRGTAEWGAADTLALMWLTAADT
jgi:hypothetical protein